MQPLPIPPGNHATGERSADPARQPGGLLRGLRLLALAAALTAAMPSHAQILPSEDGLVGHWDFQAEDLGLDSSPWARNAVAHGNPVKILGPGIDEKALRLDGASYLEIPNLGEDLNHLEELTVAAFLRVDAHQQKNVFRNQQPVSFASDRFQVRNISEGSGWQSLIADPLPPVGAWYHFAATFERGVVKLYVDGVLRSSTVVPFTETEGVAYPSWAIGARVPGGGSGVDQFFTGDIDDLQVYLTALGADEIRALANRPPTAQADQMTVSPGLCASLDVTANDTDPDGDTLALVADAVTSDPAAGSAAAITATRIRYCANLDAAGQDTFRYHVTDARGGFAEAWVTVDVQLSTGTGQLDGEVVWKDVGSQALFLPASLIEEHAETLSGLPLSTEDRQSLAYQLELGRLPVGSAAGPITRCAESMASSRLGASPSATDFTGLLAHREVALAGSVLAAVPGWDSRYSLAARLVWLEIDSIYQDPEGRFQPGDLVAYLEPAASFEVAGAELCTEGPPQRDAALPGGRILVFGDGRSEDPRFLGASMAFPVEDGRIEPQGYGLLAAWQSESISHFESDAASVQEATDVQ